MFESQLTHAQNLCLLDDGRSGNIYIRRYNMALSQFRSTMWKGKMFRLESMLLKRTPHLYDLKHDLRVQRSSYSGTQVIPISSIIGSEGRAGDFDIHFHPLSEAGRERWVNLAVVYLAGVPLPPVQLIRIGDAYFVRDGHHRISVSRTFGQAAVDAEVITWKASPPFPWQPGCCTEKRPLLAKHAVPA